MIWAAIVGGTLGASDVGFPAALLIVAVVLIPRPIAEIIFKNRWPFTGTSPYVDFVENLENMNAYSSRPALVYMAQFMLNGGIVAVLFFWIVRLLR